MSDLHHYIARIVIDATAQTWHHLVSPAQQRSDDHIVYTLNSHRCLCAKRRSANWMLKQLCRFLLSMYKLKSLWPKAKSGLEPKLDDKCDAQLWAQSHQNQQRMNFKWLAKEGMRTRFGQNKSAWRSSIVILKQYKRANVQWLAFAVYYSTSSQQDSSHHQSI